MPEAELLIRDLETLGDLHAPRALLLVGDHIAAVDEEAERHGTAARRLDATGLTAVPGFIELQLNGIAGHDFTTDPSAIWRVGADVARHGVTAFLPTIITSPRGTVEAALDAMRTGGAAPRMPGAIPLGLHVEGPFLSPHRAGAHPPELLRDPDLEEIDRWIATGALRIVTLAPERSGALEAISRLVAGGAIASVGHTDADAAMTRSAIDAGARYATHLFNAMPPLGHRTPNAPGALLDDARVTVGLILDGHHLDPLVAGLILRLAPGRVSVVSDAIGALGLADGRHRLGSREVNVGDGAARLDDGTLAGSVAGLDVGVRAMAAITSSMRAAVDAVTTVPAALLGDDQRGRLDVGARADVTLIDRELDVRMTIVGGEVAFASEDQRRRWSPT